MLYSSNLEWYITRKEGLSKTQVLVIIFVAKNMIRRQEALVKGDFQRNKEQAMAVGFKRLNEIDDIPWDRMSSILKCMKKKYANQRDHSLFEENVCLARTLWRMDST